jgi:hypothetical protein
MAAVFVCLMALAPASSAPADTLWDQRQPLRPDVPNYVPDSSQFRMAESGCPSGSFVVAQTSGDEEALVLRCMLKKLCKHDFCAKCPPGKYQPKKAQAECRTCPRGKFATQSQATCLDCPSGKYQLRENKGDCDIYKNEASRSSLMLRLGRKATPTGLSTGLLPTIDHLAGLKPHRPTKAGAQERERMLIRHPGETMAHFLSRQFLDCSAGKYKMDRTDKVTCEACPAGKYGRVQVTYDYDTPEAAKPSLESTVSSLVTYALCLLYIALTVLASARSAKSCECKTAAGANDGWICARFSPPPSHRRGSETAHSNLGHSPPGCVHGLPEGEPNSEHTERHLTTRFRAG